MYYIVVYGNFFVFTTKYVFSFLSLLVLLLLFFVLVFLFFVLLILLVLLLIFFVVLFYFYYCHRAMLAVGGDDGRIRLLDPRLRSVSVEHVLKAHTGPVQAVAVTPTDGVKVPTYLLYFATLFRVHGVALHIRSSCTHVLFCCLESAQQLSSTFVQGVFVWLSVCLFFAKQSIQGSRGIVSCVACSSACITPYGCVL